LIGTPPFTLLFRGTFLISLSMFSSFFRSVFLASGLHYCLSPYVSPFLSPVCPCVPASCNCCASIVPFVRCLLLVLRYCSPFFFHLTLPVCFPFHLFFLWVFSIPNDHFIQLLSPWFCGCSSKTPIPSTLHDGSPPPPTFLSSDQVPLTPSDLPPLGFSSFFSHALPPPPSVTPPSAFRFFFTLFPSPLSFLPAPRPRVFFDHFFSIQTVFFVFFFLGGPPVP